jgi:hypothetical protein
VSPSFSSQVPVVRLLTEPSLFLTPSPRRSSCPHGMVPERSKSRPARWGPVVSHRRSGMGACVARPVQRCGRRRVRDRRAGPCRAEYGTDHGGAERACEHPRHGSVPSIVLVACGPGEPQPMPRMLQISVRTTSPSRWPAGNSRRALTSPVRPPNRQDDGRVAGGVRRWGATESDTVRRPEVDRVRGGTPGPPARGRCGQARGGPREGDALASNDVPGAVMLGSANAAVRHARPVALSEPWDRGADRAGPAPRTKDAFLTRGA